MNNFFANCFKELPVTADFNQLNPEENSIDVVHETPLKYKLASALKIVDLGVKLCAEPRMTDKYNFDRSNLLFLSTGRSHVPLIYFPCPETSQQRHILVYCHGSGSNLNSVYDYALSLYNKYKMAVVAYDYTGEGQSKMSFSSYEQDIKLVLAWTLNKGYDLHRTILCGFSFGTYSALSLEGQMPRVLISPVCGVYAFLNGEAMRFQEQKYGTVELALRINNCKALIVHCSEEMIHISHGRMLEGALRKNSKQSVAFHEITDKGYEHRSAPYFFCAKEGYSLLSGFLEKVKMSNKKVEIDPATFKLQEELLDIVFYQCDHPNLHHLKEKKEIDLTQMS